MSVDDSNYWAYYYWTLNSYTYTVHLATPILQQGYVCMYIVHKKKIRIQKCATVDYHTVVELGKATI